MRIPKITSDDPIECLLRWKDPITYVQMNAEDKAGGGITKPNPAKAKALEDYRQKLEEMPKQQFDALYQAEKIKAEQRATELRRKLNPSAEENQSFNQPSAKADFQHWGKAQYWTLDEAVALSFGKEPEVVNWKKLESCTKIFQFAKEYEKRRDLAIRAKNFKKLFDPVIPTLFIAWAGRNDIELPDELVAAVQKYAGNAYDWQKAYEERGAVVEKQQAFIEEQKEIIASYKARIEALETANQAANDVIEQGKISMREVVGGLEQLKIKEKPVSTRTRNNMLKMIIGMAMKGYGYALFATKSNTVTEIEKDLGDLGIPVGDDTIRNYLTEAVTLLPEIAQKN